MRGSRPARKSGMSARARRNGASRFTSSVRSSVPSGSSSKRGRALGHDRGVVDQHVERAPALGDLLGGSRRRVGVGEIEREGVEPCSAASSAASARARAGGGEARLVARDAEDGRALGQEEPRRREADATRERR